MSPGAFKQPFQGLAIEILDGQGGRRAEQSLGRGGWRLRRWGPRRRGRFGLGLREHLIKLREIRRGSGIRVIFKIQAEKAARARCAGLEVDQVIAQYRHGVLMLQAAARQITHEPHRRLTASTVQAMELQGVRRVRGALAERPNQAPRLAAVDGKVLTRSNHDPLRGM